MSGAIPSRPAPAWAGRAELFLFLLLLAGPAGAADPADSLHSPTPRGALIRSALVPGWGQYCNGRPLKAVLFATGAAGFLGKAVAEQHGLNRAADAGRSDQELQDRAARRNTWVLCLLATSTLAGLDAYVDAQLAHFEIAAQVRAGPGMALVELRVPWGQ